MSDGIVVRMRVDAQQQHQAAKGSVPALVTFHPEDASIRCGGCLYRLPLSRFTMRNQARIIEELEMMRDVHKDCEADAISQSYLRKTWREAMLNRHYNGGGKHPDRLVFSV